MHTEGARIDFADRGGVVVVATTVGVDQHLGPAVPQRVRQFGGTQRRVQRDENDTGKCRAVLDHRPLDHVRRPQRNVVAGLGEPCQRGSDSACFVEELAVG